MRDFIWTLIIIWTIYQLSSLFRNRKKTAPSGPDKPFVSDQEPSEQDAKTTLRKARDSEGEYIDFEEVK
jgi:hypothetical protein